MDPKQLKKDRKKIIEDLNKLAEEFGELFREWEKIRKEFFDKWRLLNKELQHIDASLQAIKELKKGGK